MAALTNSPIKPMKDRAATEQDLVVRAHPDPALMVVSMIRRLTFNAMCAIASGHQCSRKFPSIKAPPKPIILPINIGCALI